MPCPKLKKALEEDYAIIDVREPIEIQRDGALKNAINIPITRVTDLSQFERTVGTDKLAFYCRSGARSGVVSRHLTSAGYNNVMDLGGYEVLKNC